MTATTFDRISELAGKQSGYVSLRQLNRAGISRQVAYYHEKAGRLERVVRGFYRLAVFPPHEHESQILAHLWSNGEGTVSHESALVTHDLSDALPNALHLTLPVGRRAEFAHRTPVVRPIRLYFSEIGDVDREWHGPFRVTTPARTLFDLAERRVDPEILESSLRQAKARHLIPVDFDAYLLSRIGMSAQ